MREVDVYEYAVIRVVPRVEREEFVNVGVAFYCRKQKYAKVKYHIDEHKLKVLHKDIEVALIEKHLISFQKICDGNPDAGRIALLDQTERFRWLTANRSTIIQCSATHPGLCNSAEETHENLFERLVL